MSDEELRKFGKGARYMISPRENMGKPPLPTFVLQLEEAREKYPGRLRRGIGVGVIRTKS